MNWTTIYIRGKAGFKDDVRRKLEYSGLSYMPGNSGDNVRVKTHDLYWLAEGTDLKEISEGDEEGHRCKARVEVQAKVL